MNTYDEPVYLISVVSKMLDIHPQTLRQYEREGLVTPSRSDGKIRLYSVSDIDKLKAILTLTRDLGVNLAGVDIILNLKKRLIELEDENQLLKSNQCDININSVVPSHKSLVIKKSLYEIVVFKD